MKLNILKLNTQNLFLLLLIIMIVAGKLIPFKNEYNHYFHLSAFINWGISAIFFLYGLKMNFKEIIKDLSNWKLHFLVQFGTFILFPFLVFLFYSLVDKAYSIVWLTIFFLASLPSTVSSSVVMVSIAKGNVTSAIFNASISGIIGIVMTPLLMSFFIQPANGSNNNLEIIQQLLLKILLPIILGILLNKVFRNWVIKYSNVITGFDKIIILLIVYEGFSEAFLENIFASVQPLIFLIIAICVVILFFIVYEILKLIGKKLNFKREDIITTTFCGSKKSLAHGTLFIVVLEIPENQKVLFLFPVMIYHSFQLFYLGWLAKKIG